jgi:5-oxoprolinase (ATP-hydrolysing)
LQFHEFLYFQGIQLVTELIDSYGLDVVQAYMNHIQENAEVAVRQVLKDFGRKAQAKTGRSVLSAEDLMDDGSVISLKVIFFIFLNSFRKILILIFLKVSINCEQGSAIFDFTGTGPEVWGNINAPRAVTHSALIYSLRCLVGEDIPLNQGCLQPVEIIIPEKSLLNPSDNAAVVGGNVLTSQRVVDVILLAFEACAASQGCCNNVTFGDKNFGYYETVAGGAGAGPSWHGRSGVHVHMTNTRLTDPEILEKRYPVWLKEFHLRSGSGGHGLFNGGEGVLRAIQFLAPLTLSVLTDRRVINPYGLNGGEPGQRGLNLLKRYEDGVTINLGGKCAVPVTCGDIFVLNTPGGGGWGQPSMK